MQEHVHFLIKNPSIIIIILSSHVTGGGGGESVICCYGNITQIDHSERTFIQKCLRADPAIQYSCGCQEMMLLITNNNPLNNLPHVGCYSPTCASCFKCVAQLKICLYQYS